MNKTIKITATFFALFAMFVSGCSQGGLTPENSNSGSTYNPKDCKFGEATYVWSDDHMSCTATARCLVHEDEVITETATAQRYYTAPTCNGDGFERFEVFFKKVEYFKEQYQEFRIPATGEHNWGTPQYDWEENGLTYVCHAYRGCLDCGHSETETVRAVAETIGVATFDEPCQIKYTATFQNTAFETQERTVTGYQLSECLQAVEVENDGGEVIGYRIEGSHNVYGPERFTKIVIPNEYNNLPVIEASIVLFENLVDLSYGSNLKKLDVSYCPLLTDIETLDTLENIRIYNCAKLKSLSVGKGIVNFENLWIEECPSFDTLTVSSENTAFKAENNLLMSKDGTKLYLCPQGVKGEVAIPQGVNSIESNAFSHCKAISSISIPNSVYKIGYEAFAYCESLTRLTLPDTTSNVDPSFIRDCSNLTTLYLGAAFDFTSDYDGNFSGFLFAYGCNKLANITISNSNLKYKAINNIVYSIDGKTVLHAAKALESITPASSVEKLGAGCFHGCHAVRLDLSNTKITTIPRSSTSFMDELTSISFPTTLISIGDYAFEYATSLTDFVVPETVGSIGEHFLEGCSSLTSLHIGKNVISIGVSSLCIGTPALTNIEVSSENNVFKSVGGVLFDKEMTTLYRCPANYDSGNTEYNVPNTIYRLHDDAFLQCRKLQKIALPRSLSVMKDALFWECNALETLSYDGTVSEFGQITKGEYWNDGLRLNIVKCTDGDYQINQSTRVLITKQKSRPFRTTFLNVFTL